MESEMSRNRTIRSAYNILKFNSSEYEPKMELCYIQGVNSDGDAIEEVGDEFCMDCIEESFKQTVASFEENRKFYSEKIHSLKWYIDSCPESDDIKLCNNCGDIILTGILWTFGQELDHWLDSNTQLDIRDGRTNYILRLITGEYGTFERFPDKTTELAKKIISTQIPIFNTKISKRLWSLQRY